MIKNMMNKSTWLTLGLVAIAALGSEAVNSSATLGFIKSDQTAISESSNCCDFGDATVADTLVLAGHYAALALIEDELSCGKVKLAARSETQVPENIASGPQRKALDESAECCELAPATALEEAAALNESAADEKVDVAPEVVGETAIAQGAEMAAGRAAEQIALLIGDAGGAGHAYAEAESHGVEQAIDTAGNAAENEVNDDASEARARQSAPPAIATDSNAEPVEAQAVPGADDDNGIEAKQVEAAPNYTLAA